VNKSDWKDLAEIVGMLAIVGSLLFVGLQLKQTHEIALANQYQTRSDSASDFFVNIIQSETAMRVFGKRVRPRILKSDGIPDTVKEWASDQPDDELAFWLMEAWRLNKVYDNTYFQYQAGFISQESWVGFRAEMKRDLFLENRGLRHYYQMWPEIWRQSYRDLVEEIIAEVESESD
jgi:hypothetical protein